VAVLFIVRPIAVPILEVDAEILDRLPAQLLDDTGADCIGEADRVPLSAYSSRIASAPAPSFRAESARNRCAPP
jgi:hypothetical protein